jgi:hypothetical protein
MRFRVTIRAAAVTAQASQAYPSEEDSTAPPMPSAGMPVKPSPPPRKPMLEIRDRMISWNASVANAR